MTTTHWKYPRIRRHIHVVPYRHLLAIGSSPESAIEIEDPHGVVRAVMQAANGERTVADITTIVQTQFTELTESDVVAILDQIAMHPYLVEDAVTEQQLTINAATRTRHSRNMNFMSNFDLDGTRKAQYLERMLNSKVLLLGLGGVGSALAYDLSALGVSTIVGVDFDRVDLTNLNRQILYREEHVGMKKTDAAAQTINAFNSDVQFIGIDMELSSSNDIQELLTTYEPDCVLCAADKPPLRIYQWVNEACHATGTPWIYGGNRELNSYFHTVIPGESACFACRFANLRDQGLDEAYDKMDAIMTLGLDAENNCIAASSGALGAFVTLEYFRIVTRAEAPRSVNCLTNVDYRHFAVTREDVPHNPNCAVCAQKGDSHADRHQNARYG